jgi:hypothetical protein
MSALVDMVQWRGCIGWQGVKCHHCGATHNVFCNIPCIRCEGCGHCVTLSWSHHRFTFKHPDFGFKRSVISWAMRNFS